MFVTPAPASLAYYIELIEKADATQFKIDSARSSFPTNQEIQLEMDRLQSDLDIQREGIEIAMQWQASVN